MKKNKNKKIMYIAGGILALGIFGSMLQDDEVKVEEKPKSEEVKKDVPKKEKPKVTEVSSNEGATGFGDEFAKELEMEEQYKKDIENNFIPMASAFENFSSLSDEASQNVYVVMTDDWIMNMALTLNDISTQVEKIRLMDPPPKYQGVHDKILKAMDEYQQFLDLYPKGVDNLDANIIQQSTEAMTRGTALIQEATTDLANSK